MITAVDTRGEVFLSLSQSNTNSTTFRLFIKELTDYFDKIRPKWRENHVIMIDNAPYHCSKQVLEYLEKLRVPLMFLGPYSYDIAPCELYFAKFKQTNINPTNLPIGKR